MIKKDHLLKGLNKAGGIQKTLIPILNKYISASVDFSSLPAEEKEKVTARIQQIAIEQTKHAERLNSLKGEIAERPDNVY